MQRLFLAAALFCLPLQGYLRTESVTAFFSPEDHLEKQLIDKIEKEHRSIRVCIYTLTHRDIIAALIAAKKRGVDVEVLVDKFSVKARSPLYKLVGASIPVFVWDPNLGRKKKTRRPLMHNKFCVFGDSTVWTGSFNFTYDASQIHQENALLIQDEALAHAYLNQFNTIKMRSCMPLTSYVASPPRKRAR